MYNWTERLSPTRLERYIKSPYDARVQAVLSFVAVIQTITFALVSVSVALVNLNGIADTIAGLPKEIDEAYLLCIVLLTTAAFLLYSARFDVQLSAFFKERSRYEYRLYRRSARRLTVVFLVRLIRLYLFRISCIAIAVFFGLSGAVYAILGVLSGLGLYQLK